MGETNKAALASYSLHGMSGDVIRITVGQQMVTLHFYPISPPRVVGVGLWGRV